MAQYNDMLAAVGGTIPQVLDAVDTNFRSGSVVDQRIDGLFLNASEALDAQLTTYFSALVQDGVARLYTKKDGSVWMAVQMNSPVAAELPYSSWEDWPFYVEH